MSSQIALEIADWVAYVRAMSEMTMIERAARRVAKAWDEAGRRLHRGWENLDRFEQERALFVARAVISEMREPTYAMTNIRDEWWADNMWRSMIDEALKEGPQ